MYCWSFSLRVENLIIKVIFHYYMLFFRPWWIVLWAPLNLEMSHMTLLLRLVHAWNAPLLKILSAGLIRYKMLFSCIIASAFIFLLTFSVIVSHIKPRTKLNRNRKKMAVKLSSQNVIFLPEKKRFLCLFIMCTTQTNNGYKNKFLLLCNETNNFFFLIKYYDFSLAVR